MADRHHSTPARADTIGEAIKQAEELFVAGRNHPSVAVLRPLLDGVDPDTADADQMLARAGLLFAHAAPAGVALDVLSAWAHYAYITHRALSDHNHELVGWSGCIWAGYLRRYGRHDDGIVVLRAVLTDPRRKDTDETTLFIRYQLAEALHAAGRCAEAVHEIDRAWTTWQSGPPDDTDLGVHLIRSYITMLTGCQRTQDASRMTAVAVATFAPQDMLSRSVLTPLTPPTSPTARRREGAPPASPVGHGPVCTAGTAAPGTGTTSTQAAIDLRAVVRHADELISSGRAEQAAVQLEQALAGFEPLTAPPTRDLLAAAHLFARVGEQTPHAQLAWAQCAETGSLRAYGPLHVRSIATAETLAHVLQQQDRIPYAITMLEHLTVAYARRHDIWHAVATRRHLAELLHSIGRCDDAEQHLVTAYTTWSPTGAGTAALLRRGAMIVMSHAAILAGCGRHDSALALLSDRQPVLDALEPSWRIDTGFRSHLKLADTIKDHPSVCTRPPRSAPTPRSMQTYHDQYIRLLYEDAVLANPTATGVLHPQPGGKPER